MSRLSVNSLPAERFVGCKFAETFETEAKVVRNGGTISGTPVIDFGVTLNGTTDYITYDLDQPVFNSAEISIVFEFWPDSDYDEDNQIVLYDTSGGSRYVLYKNNNAAGNTLVVLLGNTNISNIPSATYSPYWMVAQRNILVVSGTSGDTSVWLNGNIILANDSTAWSVTNPTQAFIGAAFNGTALFDGKVKGFKVFQSLLTEKDAINYYNHSMFDYRNRAVLDLPMTAATHDPGNSRTLNAGNGGSANHGVFEDVPTKLTKKGYSLDGTNDAFSCGNCGTIKTVAMMIKPTTTTEDIADMDGGTHTIEVTGGTITATGFISPIIYVDGKVSSTLIAGIWQTIAITTATGFSANAFKLGKETTFFDGSMMESKLSADEWTTIQVADYHLDMKKKIQQV